MLKDLLLSSRSYRSFDESVKISREQLLNWIDHTRLCPSSINLQMLKFRPVTDETECAEMLARTKWAGKLKGMQIPPMEHAPTAYIVVCSNSSVTPNATMFQKDVGICAQTIMLAAAEDGFGGCMIGSFSPEKVKELLHLPEETTAELVLALGKPDETVRLTELPMNGDTSYYRADGIHYVPKRALEDILLS